MSAGSGRGAGSGTTEKQINLFVRAGLEPGTSELRVQSTLQSTTLPRNRTVKPNGLLNFDSSIPSEVNMYPCPKADHSGRVLPETR